MFQLKAFRRLFLNNNITYNYRPTQNLNGRRIFYSEYGGHHDGHHGGIHGGFDSGIHGGLQGGLQGGFHGGHYGGHY